MTKQEKIEWEELYQYVKIDVMGYTNKVLPKNFILRLRGLSEGKFMANKNSKSQASYTFKEILLTFKLCKSKIDECFARNASGFKDEAHKFNTVMRIIESDINNTVLMLSRKKNAEEKADLIDDSINYESAEYKKKGVINNKLNDLW